MDPSIKATKIAALVPNQKHLQMEFQITDVISQDSSGLLCRIVDDTGIVNAYFEKYTEKLQKNSVYQMTNLKSKVVSNHIQIQMSKSTVVSKEPSTLGFRDKANDISKKFYVAKQEEGNQKNQFRQYLVQESKKPQILIPVSRQQAMQELRLKKQFEQKTKRKQKYDKTENKKETQGKPTQYKEKEEEKKDNTVKYKEKNPQSNLKYVEKEDPKKQIYNTPQKYKEKKSNQNKKSYKKAEQNENNSKRSNTKQLKYVEKQQKTEKKQQKQKEQLAKNKKQEDQKTENINDKKSEKNENEGANKEEEKNKAEEKEEYCQYIPLLNVPQHVQEHVNVKVYVSTNKRNQKDEEYDCLVADKSGSLWAHFSNKISIEGGNWYEIDNLQVIREDTSLLLKQTDISQAKMCLEDTNSFELKPIKV